MNNIFMQDGFLKLCLFGHETYTLPIYYCR